MRLPTDKQAVNTVYNRTTNKDASIIELFFHLIRCGIGKQSTLPCTPNAKQWNELFEIAKKQTLAGIAFAGIERLPQEQRPPKEILLQWYQLCMTIKSMNAELDRKCAIVSNKFKSEGFENCILKGQGIARLYPDPTLRTPGDIDIWLGGGDDKAIGYVRRFFPNCEPTYHHVDFPIAQDLEIEIHYRPSWAYSPLINKRLQAFFAKQAAQQFSNSITTANGDFPAPTLAFNRIYILLHIYRHLFFEGIGMRQLLDYYFVLQQQITPEEKEEYIRLLQSFGLKKFAGAATYAMQRMFGLDDEHALIEPNRRTGEFLIREIMIAGNFGKYDHRYDMGAHEYSFKRAVEVIRHNMTLLTRFPGETLWSPYFKIWHYIWRKRHAKRD